GGFAPGAPETFARPRAELHREPDDVCARPPPGRGRHGDRAGGGAAGRGLGLPVLGIRARNRQDAGVSDEECGRTHGDRTMTFITGKGVPRRPVRRGLGATVPRPFLDAMIPARGLLSRVASAATPDRTRLVCIEMVHGAAGASDWGASQHLW